jgi:hypothetical protein
MDHQEPDLEGGRARPALANYVGRAELIDGRRRDITIQKHSVLIRVALLQQYGGVGVDATVSSGLLQNTGMRPAKETEVAHRPQSSRRPPRD